MIRLTPLALLLTAAPAMAAGFQDTVLLDRAVAGFTGRAIGESGGARAAVDARLKLAGCAMVSLAWRTPAQDAVVVRCSGPEWRLFVPVIMPVAQPAVPAAVTPIAAAAPRPAALPPVIKRGDPVTIEANAGGFTIAREGVAMADAAPGARFLVKVDGGKAPVQATAVDTGRATLPGWGQ